MLLRLALSAACFTVAMSFFMPRPAAADEPFHVVTWETTGPVAEPWVTLEPPADHHGQWLVAGDLDNDGTAEIVTARNDKQVVTAAVATRLDGTTLWTWGRPGAGSPVLNYDVPVQIHDLDRDDRPEVYLSIQGHLVVLDGPTGRELRRHPLPDGLRVADCITFADLRGKGFPGDIIIKTRYTRLWAFTADWQPLWDWTAPEGDKTCHHPTPMDVDRDRRDEILAGYTLLDHDGRDIWTMTTDTVDLARGHLDACEIYRRAPEPTDWRLVVTCCGAHRIAMLDGAGRTLWDIAGHHFESIDAGHIRDDAPGPQILTDIDHEPYREAPVWLLDAKGRHLGTFLCGTGRHHRLIDWDGDGLDDILIGNTRRVFDGHGRCIARLGPLGGFDGEVGQQKKGDSGPFAATGDLDGDQRPEIILHSATTVRIYRSPRNRVAG